MFHWLVFVLDLVLLQLVLTTALVSMHACHAGEIASAHSCVSLSVCAEAEQLLVRN